MCLKVKFKRDGNILAYLLTAQIFCDYSEVNAVKCPYSPAFAPQTSAASVNSPASISLRLALPKHSLILQTSFRQSVYSTVTSNKLFSVTSGATSVQQPRARARDII